MPKKNISEDRKKYLRKIAINKTIVISTQIGIVLIFILLWEVLADKNIIDSFIMSQPSRILETFVNLSENQLLMHLWVTCEETLIRIFTWCRNWYHISNSFMVVRLFK